MYSSTLLGAPLLLAAWPLLAGLPFLIRAMLREILAQIHGSILTQFMVLQSDAFLWLLTTLIEAFAVYLFVSRGLLRKFLFLNLYFLLLIQISIEYCFALRNIGLAPVGSVRAYCYTNALLSIVLFLSVCELCVRLDAAKKRGNRVLLLCGVGALLLAGLFAIFVARSENAELFMVAAASRQMFLVCCLSIGVAWAWMLRRNPDDRIAVRILTVLSVYAGLFLLAYGVGRPVRATSIIYQLPLMAGAWLPLGCGFAAVSEPPAMQENS